MTPRPVAPAMAGALSLQPWQWGVIAVAYVLFFLLPAVWMWRKAIRDGENAFFWMPRWW